MRVNEIRRNTVGTAKTNGKANCANKQAFSALPYMSKTTSRTLSIGKALYPVIEPVGKALYPVIKIAEKCLNKLKSIKLFKKQEKWEHDWIGFAKEMTP